MKCLVKIQPAVLLLLAACGSSSSTESKKQEPPRHAKILQFYGANTQVTKGQTLTICYGVEDAVSVSLEPPEEQLSPSRNRCFAVSPKRDTTYMLVAKGADGQKVRQPFPVRVVAQQAVQTIQLIRTFDVMSGKPGQPVNLCYQSSGAVSLKLEPPLFQVQPAPQPRCFPVNITQRTTFLLTATDAAGNVDRMQVTAVPN